MAVKNMKIRVVVLLFIIWVCFGDANNNLVFRLQHRYGGNGSPIWREMRAHDLSRHSRHLTAIDFKLGGNGHSNGASLYYTRLLIGTPPMSYHVQVDTGSNILWLQCAGCETCPKTSSLGVQLRMYDRNASSTSNLVTCDQDLCRTMNPAPYSFCHPKMACEYQVNYADGGRTAGSIVQDQVHFDQVVGNFLTTSLTGTIAFGCSTTQSGTLSPSTQALDGIIGFGQANSSLISQLATLGKVKRIFSHCLNGQRGGGILAIGQVVWPKVKSTPLVPHQPHYTVTMESIEVGGAILDIPSDSFDPASGRGTIIDSGTTIAYFADRVYNLLVRKVMEKQRSLKTDSFLGLTCFSYKGNVDDGFPDITFHFKDSLELTIHPHDYLFQLRVNHWCIALQRTGGPDPDGTELTILGDVVLNGKLVVYDVESQKIGWIPHDCSTTIRVKDEITGRVYTVGAHDISPPLAPRSNSNRRTTNVIFMIFFIISILYVILW